MDDILKNDEEASLSFEFRRMPVSEGRQEENWKAVEAAIRQQEGAPVRVMRPVQWGKVFAAAACLMTLAFGIWYIGARTGHPQIAEIKTGYGEIKNVLLPDSSVVILNANSSIRIAQQWTEKEGRQVWLEGEAYFQVQKKPSAGQPFTVHTRQVNVEVLGTRFNVNTRRQHSIVSLEEGKIRLSVPGTKTAVIEKKEPVIMRPGQVAVVEASSLTRINNNNEKEVSALSGWTRHEFHFDNTSLGEIARMIEDTYGYKMEVEDPGMFNVAISGDLRVTNIQELVKVLEVPSGYVMRIKEKTIYVTTH